MKVRLVPENEKGNAGERFMLHEIVELLLGVRDQWDVGNVNDEDDGTDAPTVSLPHGSKPRLSANVPALECNMAPLYFLHIKTDSGNRATQYLESADTSVPNPGVGRVGPLSIGTTLGSAYSRVNSPPYEWNAVNDGHVMDSVTEGGLTARTRSKDVLPAFCNPTMVTSISMALMSSVSTRPAWIAWIAWIARTADQGGEWR